MPASDDSRSELIWTSSISVHRPMIVAAFEGWNDAADSATTAANHLRTLWDAEPVAEIDAEPFFDFTSMRPVVHLDDESQRRIQWPANTVYQAGVPGAEQDVMIVIGTEPQLQWRTFCEQVIDLANLVDARLIVTMGALLADVPHSRPVTIYGTSDDPLLSDELGLERSSYEGPTGIVGVLNEACQASGLPSASLWAAVPSYIPGAPSPKAALAIIERLAVVLGTPIDTTDLQIASASYDRQVSELVGEDADTADYVRELEAAYDAIQPPPLELDADEDIVAEVEKFLRDQ